MVLLKSLFFCVDFYRQFLIIMLKYFVGEKMLIKKENKIEVWSEKTSKKSMMIIFFIIEVGMTVIGCIEGISIIGWLCFTILWTLLALYFYRIEKEKYLKFYVDSKYIEMYSIRSVKHNLEKKIELEQINKVKIYFSGRRTIKVFAKFFYKEGEIEKTYVYCLHTCCDAQIVEWFIMALKQYNENIIIEDKTNWFSKINKKLIK